MLTRKQTVGGAALLVCFLSVAVCAQTQAALNDQACAEYARADSELNATYRQILRERRADAAFLRNMRAAQRAWIAYRDAHLAALYPSAAPRRDYGSSYPTCRCAALTAATKSRAEELKRWASGAPEGDVCAGSTRAAVGTGAAPGVGEHEGPASVFRKRWILTGVGERSFATGTAYLEFNVKQGRFSGSGGCNRILGGYRVDGNDLSFTPGPVTLRACADEAAQQIETSFFEALGRTTSFEIEGEVVRLYGNNSQMLTFKLGAAGEAGGTQPTVGSVTGTVTYRQRSALPPGAVIEVKLLDVSRADAPAVTIAEQTVDPAGRQVPIAFELTYDAGHIVPNRRYAVRASILENNRLLFTSTQSYPVITGGNPSKVEIVVSPVR